MNDFKDLAELLKDKIKTSNKKILLSCHRHPDPDSVGSVLAMAQAIEQLGGEAEIISGDTPISDDFHLFPQVEKIKEKAVKDVDWSQYDLFLSLDSASLAQVGEGLDLPWPVASFVVDHHLSNTLFADYNLIDDQVSATAEILYKLFILWEVAITKEMAVNLMLGIYFDSGGFKYERVTANTFSVAETLAQIAPDYNKYILNFERQNQPVDLKFLKLAFEKIEVIGNLALSLISFDDLVSEDLTGINFSRHSVANWLISIKDWQVGIGLLEVKPGLVKINFRSKEPTVFNVSLLASVLGGGGHPAAAGATVEGTVMEVKEKIVVEIKKMYPELLE
ncbi:MAG: DHH family phosphoesterase [Patescibacteria group bacterium]